VVWVKAVRFGQRRRGSSVQGFNTRRHVAFEVFFPFLSSILRLYHSDKDYDLEAEPPPSPKVYLDFKC
jgi:hypothetical protein